MRKLFIMAFLIPNLLQAQLEYNLTTDNLRGKVKKVITMVYEKDAQNKKGKLQPSWVEKVKYDKNGNRKEYFRYFSNKFVIFHDKYFYNKSGLLYKVVKLGVKEMPILIDSLVYDDNNRIIKVITKRADGPTICCKVTYDSLRVSLLNEKTNKMFIEYDYNNRKQLSRILIYNLESGKEEMSQVYTYDTLSYLKAISYYSQNKLTYSDLNNLEKFDKNGNWIVNTSGKGNSQKKKRKIKYYF